MQTAMNRPQNPPQPLSPPFTHPLAAKGVGGLIITKSKERENKSRIVLIVFTYTKNIKTGQSDCAA